MWCALNVQDVSRKLKTNIETGLTDEEAKKRQEQFGKNKLNEAKKTSIIVRFLRQFNDFMIIILLISAGISAGISYYEHSNDYIDSIIIVGIVILNAIMGVIQESKADSGE